MQKLWSNKISNTFWRTPKLLGRLDFESKDENIEKMKSWGTLFDSQHFKGRKACWSFGMKTRTNDKRVNYSHRPPQTKQQVD